MHNHDKVEVEAYLPYIAVCFRYCSKSSVFRKFYAVMVAGNILLQWVTITRWGLHKERWRLSYELMRATHELCTAENYAYKSAHISSFFRRPPHRRRPTFYTGLSEKLWDVIRLCVSLSPRVLCYNAAPVAVLLTRHSQFRSLRRSHDCIKFQPSGRTPHNHHSIVTRFLFTKCLENQTVSTLLS